MNKERRKVTMHLNDGYPIVTQKQDRNTLCKCGSGKKAKKCCGDQTRFYTTKPKEASTD